mgnify:CR=1 FL=1|jgi:hypothetical protein
MLAVVPGQVAVSQPTGNQSAAVINGILQPPPDLKSVNTSTTLRSPPHPFRRGDMRGVHASPTHLLTAIIDKTATFVARNGPEFENRILKNEQNNIKFSFLQPNDPYQPYYKSRVVELGGAVQPAAATNVADVAKETTAKTQKKGPSVTPVEPPRPNYSVSKPQGAQPLDIDVIQLTAQ